jgi:hypothetical protein
LDDVDMVMREMALNALFFTDADMRERPLP